MKYDFDQIIDRNNTNALKRDGWREYIFHAGPDAKFAFEDDEFIHMWVADMEFRCADEIIEELHKRVDHGIFGYTTVYKMIIPTLSRHGAREDMTGSSTRKSSVTRPASSPLCTSW